MVVAGNRQHAAELGSARGIGVTEYVAATIHARALAVPHAEYAIVLGALEDVDLLGAPERGGGEVFVDPGLEHRVVLLEVIAGFPQGLVEVTQGRAAVTGNETCGIEACVEVALALHQRQAHQRLDTGQQYFSALLNVLVVQGR